MNLSPGGGLGPYEVLQPVGAGGMGEVYPARDPRLGRDVAREAQVLPSLIYSVEERALMMELVEGPTLAERLAPGAIPGDDALPRISTDGGNHPLWSQDGKALVHTRADGRIIAVDYTASRGAFMAGKPRVRWDRQIQYLASSPSYDLAPEGKRFIVLPRPKTEESATGSLHVTVLLNFFVELRRRVALGGK